MNNKRLFVFRHDNGELVLPVTPSEFVGSAGKRIETINIVDVGDVHAAGHETLATIKISSFFPANRYSFANNTADPYALVAQFQAWAKSQKVVRFLVTGTALNLPVLVEAIDYGENDGSNDVNYTLTLREYKYLKTATVSTERETGRQIEESPVIQETYTVQSGDNLTRIARRFYGDGSLAYKLATANNIKNPNLIYDGQDLVLPPAEELEAFAATPAIYPGTDTSDDAPIATEDTGYYTYDPGIDMEQRVTKAETLHESRW